MFKKILVPLDLTDKHKEALAITAELAKQSGGAVVLLHVVETIPGLPELEEKDFYNRLERTAQTHLESFAASLLAQGIPCLTQVVLGHRARETAARAKQIAADLIILTTPRFDPEHPIDGWGSMSWKIGLMAPCSVLLVK
jgi:nucleotide-binding universal stress UspA family protein